MNQDLQLQIYQGSGFQRGGVHASEQAQMASPGFHAGGVYATVRTGPARPTGSPELVH